MSSWKTLAVTVVSWKTGDHAPALGPLFQGPPLVHTTPWLPLIKTGFSPTWSQEAAALTRATFKLLGIVPGRSPYVCLEQEQPFCRALGRG